LIGKELREVLVGYKFYLAFENSDCEDYVTEKLYNAFLAGAIPIVRGPPDYSRYIPTNHSVIHTRDFQSPKDLAAFLTELLADEARYQFVFLHFMGYLFVPYFTLISHRSYFHFRGHPELFTSAFNDTWNGKTNSFGWCKMCETLVAAHKTRLPS
jgi:hypothetical protein